MLREQSNAVTNSISRYLEKAAKKAQLIPTLDRWSIFGARKRKLFCRYRIAIKILYVLHKLLAVSSAKKKERSRNCVSNVL